MYIYINLGFKFEELFIVIVIGFNRIILLGGNYCFRLGFLEGEFEIEFFF